LKNAVSNHIKKFSDRNYVNSLKIDFQLFEKWEQELDDILAERMDEGLEGEYVDKEEVLKALKMSNRESLGSIPVTLKSSVKAIFPPPWLCWQA